jgi:hypothetical protein
MAVRGKKVVFWFYGIVIGVALLALVTMVPLRPEHNRDQENLARRLSLIYQKFRFDHKAWPDDMFLAADNYRSEQHDILEELERAEKEWGLQAEMVSEDPPTLEVRFERPRPWSRQYALLPEKRR